MESLVSAEGRVLNKTSKTELTNAKIGAGIRLSGTLTPVIGD
jgi:hypothetical protein